jgi:hypothetical protein
MTATTSNVDTLTSHSAITFAKRLAAVAGSIAAAVGLRWHAFAEAGQLGPDRERTLSRHTGARI